MNKIINWMTRRKDWLLTKFKIEAGVRLNEDLEKHLKYFNMVVKYAHLTAESDRTKKLLMASLGDTLRNTDVRTKTHKYLSFRRIIQMAIENKEIFNRAPKEKNPLELDHQFAAALQEKNPKKN